MSAELMTTTSVRAASAEPTDLLVLADGRRLALRPVGSEDRDEVAVVVADELQNLGIGIALAWHTVQRARANGFALLTATTLRENGPARALLQRFEFRARNP